MFASAAPPVQRTVDAKITTSTADAFWSSGPIARLQCSNDLYALSSSKGYAVLMHDADVILRDAGFSTTSELVFVWLGRVAWNYY